MSVPDARSIASIDSMDNDRATRLLCRDVGEPACVSACPDDREPREHADCLIRFRFGADPAALSWARALYARNNALVGVAPHDSIEGYRGQQVALFPALPIGEHRHHLAWLHASLTAFDALIEALASRAEKPVLFRPRPHAFGFFETAVPAYPSAYCSDGVIAYNLRGPLHANHRDMHETLFHELFHINDDLNGGWSESALGPLFDSIVERCGDDHECYGRFAPHDTIVEGGTYYTFDPRTRGVREYAAELALRYFLEQEAILAGQREIPPFKCRASENRVAWDRIVDAFFGGADLSSPCEGLERSLGDGDGNNGEGT